MFSEKEKRLLTKLFLFILRKPMTQDGNGNSTMRRDTKCVLRKFWKFLSVNAPSEGDLTVLK
jgi:hypothetical protein